MFCNNSETMKPTLHVYSVMKKNNIPVKKIKLDGDIDALFNYKKVILHGNIDHYKVLNYKSILYKVLVTSSIENI